MALQRLAGGIVLGEYCGTVKTVAEHQAEVGEVPDDLGYLHHDKSFDVPPYPEDKRDTALVGSGRDLKLVIDGGCKGNRLAFINDIENTGRGASVKAVRFFSVSEWALMLWRPRGIQSGYLSGAFGIKPQGNRHVSRVCSEWVPLRYPWH